MRQLKITFLSVGNGDSIFLEYSQDDLHESHFALIDCNDAANLKSTHIYLKRYFESKKLTLTGRPLFDFIMLSHSHADHSRGLQDIMEIYGTKEFYNAKNSKIAGDAPIIVYVRDNFPPIHHVKLSTYSQPIWFGDAKINILWPLSDRAYSNENNNSLILRLEHGNNIFLFGGDAEYSIWQNQDLIQEINTIDSIQVFKVPHHGANSGAINPGNTRFYWDYIANKTDYCVISSHIKPHGHPHNNVLDNLNNIPTVTVLDTSINKHQNIEFCSDGKNLEVKYFNIVS